MLTNLVLGVNRKQGNRVRIEIVGNSQTQINSVFLVADGGSFWRRRIYFFNFFRISGIPILRL